MSSIVALFERLRRAPFPVMGTMVDDFALYDSLLAGCASRASEGRPLDASDVPRPDPATLIVIARLRGLSERSQEEQDFLAYFDLLEEVRACLLGRAQG